MEQQRIIDASQRLLQQHRCHAEKNFVKTRAYRKANEILRQHRRLIITGKSGQGKTYMAHQLLMKIIAENPNMKPLSLSTVEQWKSLVDSSVRFGIIVDDICGNICMNEGELMKWREESRYMADLIENGNHVVIFTMKSYFSEKILVTMNSCPLFSTTIVVNMDNIKLTFEEKNEFAKTYLKEYALGDFDVLTICQTVEATVGFPQLCKAAERINNKSRLIGLFSRPSEMILGQINHFRMEDKMTYGCLVLVLLSRGKLNLQSIRKLADDRQRKENIAFFIFSSCGIPDVVPLEVVNTLDYLKGTYLSFDECAESYSFAHDSIEDAVFCSYLKLFPEQTLLYCPLQLICKRCTMLKDSKDIHTTPQSNELILQPFWHLHLINRIKIVLGECIPTDFRIVSEANIWTCKRFRKAFFADCKEIHFIVDKENNSLLVHAANANNRDLVEELLHEMENIPEDKKKNIAQFLTKSVQASCAHKDTYLIAKICNNGRVDVNEILQNSIQNGSVEAIEFLLESGADVKYKSKNGKNVLQTACRHGRFDVIKFLYSKRPNLLNELDKDQTIGFSVAAGGHVDILEFLLTLGLNPMYTNQAGWNLLHYACLDAKKAMAEHLADKYSELLYSETQEGLSVLMCAAYGGSIYIFSKMYALMHNSSKIYKSSNQNMTNDIRYLTQKTKKQETIMHMSCLGGCLEMTKYLVQTCPNMLHEVDLRKQTPAHHAACTDNITLLNYLIDCGANPLCRNSEQETLLHIACWRGRLEMSKHLVQTYPAMLSEVTDTGSHAAHYAAGSGNIAVLNYLIDRDTDPWCKNNYKQTILHFACMLGQLEMSKHLVETYPAMLHHLDETNGTPAHYAAFSGNIDLLNYLIECGTYPLCETSEKVTLLHKSCMRGQLEMSKHLVETYPAMLHHLDETNGTPAHYAALSGNIDLLNYLIECGTYPLCETSEKETLLHKSCMRGQLEMSKHLVETYPALLHQVGKENATPAHYAAHSDNIFLLNYLINCGADPCCRTIAKENLLHIACSTGRLEMIKHLVQTYPAMLSEVDALGSYAAHYAAGSGNIAVLSYLIDHDTDPWCKNNHKQTILHFACVFGRLEMSKHLVETFPALLHQVDKRNATPAHYAAHSGNIDILSYLIDRGTDPWCKTSEEETLLHISYHRGQLEMSKHLVQMYPAMLHQVDKMKRTPAQRVANNDSREKRIGTSERGKDEGCQLI